MRRQLIIIGAATAFAILLLVSVSATVAAPSDAPMLQSAEVEPNDDFDTANPVSIPGYTTGVVSETDRLDYFETNTESGRQYQASLNVLYRTGNLALQICVYKGNGDVVGGCSNSSVSWTAYDESHYARVEALLSTTTTVQYAEYRLDIDRLARTPTPTATPVTPTPTNTPLGPTPSGGDSYEVNDSFADAYLLPVQTTVTLNGLNFSPAGDEDWFKLWTKGGKWYQVTTSGLSGVDTYVEIRDRNNTVIYSDDDGGGGYASQVDWQASYDGYHYLRLTNKAGSGTYNLEVKEINEPDDAATSTPGPTPSSPGADRCDKVELGNHDFDHACVISVNKPEEFNFSPPPYGGPDNDFFKVWVKQGLLFECATSNLSSGVDPNMIVYDHNRNALGGNDDVEPGNYNSYFSYYATYEGWLYLLVGYGDRTPSNPDDSSYTLACDTKLPGEPTTTGTPEGTAAPEEEEDPTATTGPQASTPTSIIATSTPAEELTVRPLTTPTPVPETTPAPQFIPITLLVYYDGNDDRQPGAGEGIAGISAQAYEVATNQLLAQGFTDDRGNLEFTVATSGPVRVRVPFFGFSQLVAGEGASVYLRVPPQPFAGQAR